MADIARLKTRCRASNVRDAFGIKANAIKTLHVSLANISFSIKTGHQEGSTSGRSAIEVETARTPVTTPTSFLPSSDSGIVPHRTSCYRHRRLLTFMPKQQLKTSLSIIYFCRERFSRVKTRDHSRAWRQHKRRDDEGR